MCRVPDVNQPEPEQLPRPRTAPNAVRRDQRRVREFLPDWVHTHLLILCGVASMVLAGVLSARVWWLQAPIYERRRRWEAFADVAAIWWLPAALALAGIILLVAVARRRVRVRRAIRSKASGERSARRGDWSNAVAALAAAFTVLVAVAAMLYTNAANRAQARLTERGQLTQRFRHRHRSAGHSRQ